MATPKYHARNEEDFKAETERLVDKTTEKILPWLTEGLDLIEKLNELDPKMCDFRRARMTDVGNFVVILRRTDCVL